MFGPKLHTIVDFSACGAGAEWSSGPFSGVSNVGSWRTS